MAEPITDHRANLGGTISVAAAATQPRVRPSGGQFQQVLQRIRWVAGAAILALSAYGLVLDGLDAHFSLNSNTSSVIGVGASMLIAIGLIAGARIFGLGA